MLMGMAFPIMPRMVMLVGSVVIRMLVGMNLGVAGMRMLVLVLVKMVVDVIVGVLMSVLYPIRMGMLMGMGVLVPVSMNMAMLMFPSHDNSSFLQENLYPFSVKI
jgi:hypothetical protein